MSSDKLTVLVVDDRHLARSALCGMLNQQDEIEVVGEACDAEQTVRQVNTLRPDIILIDSQAHSVNPAAITRTTLERCGPAQPVVLILANDTDSLVSQALAAGACGVLLNSLTVQAMVAGIRIAAAGYLVLAPSPEQTQLRRELGDSTAGVHDTTVLDALTSRELDVLRLIAEGMTNAEISAVLSLSESTTKSHVQHILTKLGMRSRVNAVIFAYQVGLVAAERRRPHPVTVPRMREPRRAVAASTGRRAGRTTVELSIRD